MKRQSPIAAIKAQLNAFYEQNKDWLCDEAQDEICAAIDKLSDADFEQFRSEEDAYENYKAMSEQDAAEFRS